MSKKELTLEERVATRLGETRLAALAMQPMCMARANGMQDILKDACAECAGHPAPLISAAVRVLQLCGSQATLEDLTP